MLGRLLRAVDTRKARDDALGNDIRRGAYALAKRALLDGLADTGMTVTLYTCLDRSGDLWGDWKITVQRIAPPTPPEDPTHDR